MAYYRLSPLEAGLTHRDWAASTYVGECIVSAETQKKARDYAKMAFAIATKRDGGPLRFCPWGQEELVGCAAVPEGVDDRAPDGLVMMPEASGWPDFMAWGPNIGEIWPPFRGGRRHANPENPAHVSRDEPRVALNLDNPDLPGVEVEGLQTQPKNNIICPLR